MFLLPNDSVLCQINIILRTGVHTARILQQGLKYKVILGSVVNVLGYVKSYHKQNQQTTKPEN